MVVRGGAGALAEVRGWSSEEAQARTEAAFFALFDRVPRPSDPEVR